MFYSTQIKSVGYGGAYDISGKWLAFIGYLPVKVGDTVYTDGNVIFGNVAPKGSNWNITLLAQPGIPVLADNLRGFFTKAGIYKSYPIAGENWIVNGNSTYFHDIGNAEIIDADIALDSGSNEIGLFTVEKELKIFGQFSAGNTLYYQQRSRAGYRHTYYSSSLDNIHALNSNYPIYETTIFTEDVDKQYDYLKQGNNIFSDCYLTFRKSSNAKSQVVKLSEIVASIETLTRGKIDIDIPDHEYTDDIISKASIRNFKVNPDGSWVALIEGAICAERRFYEKTHTIKCQQIHSSSSEKIPVDQTDTLPEGSLKAAIKNLISSVITPTHYVVDTHNYSYTETVEDYTTPSSTFAIENYLFKVTSTGDVEKIFLNGRYIPLYFIDIIDELGTNYQLVVEDGTFPVYSCSNNGTYYSGTLIYVFEPQVAWLPANAAATIDERQRIYIVRSTYRYNSRNLDDAPNYDNGELYSVEYFAFPIQDDYFAKIVPYIESTSCSLNFDGIFETSEHLGVNSSSTLSKIFSASANLSVVPLKNSIFLFGDRFSGNLYKLTTSGSATLVGRGFKNFRLRELDDISKARS